MLSGFTMTEMEMLTEGGYVGGFIEDVEEGDEIATKISAFSREDEESIRFVKVLNLKKIPRYERDEWGKILSEDPDYLLQFVGIHQNGVHEPIQLGSGWAMFRKVKE